MVFCHHFVFVNLVLSVSLCQQAFLRVGLNFGKKNDEEQANFVQAEIIQVESKDDLFIEKPTLH